MSTLKLAVIGHPISQSKSPLIHNTWLKSYSIPGEYEAIDIEPENLSQAVKSMVYKGYAGFNVTVPHKQAIMDECTVIDDKARIIGAVNTVKIQNGELFGTNTDGFGFTSNIIHAAPHFDFDKGPALLLGAGGAARAIVYALINEGVPEIILSNRTREKAEALADHFARKTTRIKIVDWDHKELALKNLNLLVNTTSLGMNNQPELKINLSTLPETALVNDIVYAPLMTDLLQAAQKRGNTIVTGIGMLLHQARPAFELWTGQLPEVSEELEEAVLA